MKKFLTILCFCVSFGSIFGVMVQNPGLSQSPTILTFTVEGCQFAKRIGLNIKQDNHECTAVARFDSYRLGGGGSVRLDDDKVVVISSSSLLAWHPAPDDAIPDTRGQKNALLFYWIFMLLTVSFTVIGFKLAFGNEKESPGNGTSNQQKSHE